MDKLQTLYKNWQMLQPLNARKQHLLSQRFSVDYNFNSNHIEGNTLTYGQTELLLLFGKVVGEGELKAGSTCRNIGRSCQQAVTSTFEERLYSAK